MEQGSSRVSKGMEKESKNIVSTISTKHELSSRCIVF